MPRYLVTWKANAAAWPADPKQTLAILEMALGGGTQLRDSGMAKDIGMITAQDGFAIFEADSKATLIGAIQGFFPFYSQEVHEITEWDAGAKAILDNARQNAGG